jgi:hypothetical protein
MATEHELTREFNRDVVPLTDEEIRRNEHSATARAKKTITGPLPLKEGDDRSLAPLSGAIGVATTLELGYNKVYRIIGSAPFHFFLTKSGSPADVDATIADTYQPADEPLIISTGKEWNQINFIQASGAGTLQAQELK